ncbi:lambda-exonuclease family protein [Corynebacterium sp. AOP34-AQ2-28]|uniref:lambda-exonuclease family protein n=1 Tax=Corynebacterium sp. AOP34-AQ2-28 TaxID=3457689 RepID=UPI004034278E
MHTESYQQQPSGHILPGSDEHRRLVTGSKISAILGLSKFETPAELWHRMRGDVPPQESTPAMRRGHNQEDSILSWYFTEMRPDLEQTSGEQTFTRPDLPWAAANPDAVATEDAHSVFIDAKSIARDGGEWGKPGTDQVPLYYVTQMMWAMHMTHGPDGMGVTRTYIVKHGPYVDQYDEYFVDYDPTLAAKIEQRCYAFHRSLADEDGCPPITDRAGTHRVFAKLHPDIVPDSVWEISPTVARDYLAARDRTKAAQAAEDGAKARILTAMGTAKTAVCGGVKIGYRREVKSGVAFYPPPKPVDVSDLPDEQEDAA